MGDEEKEASKITLSFGFSYYWGDNGAIYLRESTKAKGNIGLGKGNQEYCFEHVKFKIPARHSNVRFLVGNWIYKSRSQRREVSIRVVNLGRH